MRLVQLYSNRPKVFETVRFRRGLNVILGEIRRPENRGRDTHNLGKTILSQLIDFCLLLGKDAEFFLFKHEDRFGGFVFFLELELDAGRFLTIRRSVDNGSKASFVRHDDQGESIVDLGKKEWEHWELSFDRAKQLLDGYLALDAVKPWGFRKAIAYSLRTQQDYDDPFSLAKYGSGKHGEWKPYLAHILGLDWKLVQENYGLQAKLKGLEADQARLSLKLDKTAEDRDQLQGRIAIQRRALDQLSAQVDSYNFDLADAEINEDLVDKLDARIASLNEERYRLVSDEKRIRQAMEERIVFDLKKTKRLFEDAHVYFGEQLVKDYEQLTAFNRAISDERDQYLEEELAELEEQMAPLGAELKSLNAARASALSALRDKETFSKYKKITRRLVSQRTELELLETLLAAFDQREAIEGKIRACEQRQQTVQSGIRENVASNPERYTEIRTAFDTIVQSVINQHSNLFSRVNKNGNLDFKAELIDDVGRATGATKGFTYGRILCIAFDLAVQQAYLDEAYAHFVYHDGFLQTLDDRKKLNLIQTSRDLSAKGVQYIVTLIDSELPKLPDESTFAFDDEEVILVLHDDGDDGRLFKMAAW